MLLFTNEQNAAVIAEREAFDAQMEALASRHANSMLVGNAIGIPIDAWRRIDQQARDIQRDVLVVFNRLSSASQTPISIADLVSFYPQVSDSGEVQVTMDGRLSKRGDQALVKYEGTPVPVLTSTATFGWRDMEVIRKGGGMIDTKSIGNKQRKIAEKLEDMVLNGLSSIVVGGATIYGLRTFPQRNTNTHSLDLIGATGAQWEAVFKDVGAKLIADNAFGKATVFLNYADWYYAANTEYVAGYPKKILTVLMENSQIAEIVQASKVPTNEVIGVAGIGTGGWGTMLNAMGMVTRPQARQNPEDEYVFNVLTAAAPQFQADYNGQSHLVHLTKT
jgi:uncharacterized linocin/CFP29 family protein